VCLKQFLAKSACLAKTHFLKRGHGLVNFLFSNLFGCLYAVFPAKTKQFGWGFAVVVLLSRAAFGGTTFFTKTKTKKAHFLL
jgi:hypothetical protein